MNSFYVVKYVSFLSLLSIRIVFKNPANYFISALMDIYLHFIAVIAYVGHVKTRPSC